LNARANTADGLTVGDYLRPLWRFKWIALAVIVFVSGATYKYYDGQPRVYSAFSEIYLGPGLGDDVLGGATGGANDTRTNANQARLIISPQVVSAVARDLGYKGDRNALLSLITVTPDPSTDFVKIAAVAGNASVSAALANGFAEHAIAYRRDQRVAVLRKALSNARSQLAEVSTNNTPVSNAQRQAITGRISIIETEIAFPTRAGNVTTRATPPAVADSPKPTRSALFAMVLALLACIVAAYVFDRADRRVRRPSQAEELYEVPLLATVPRVRQPIPRDGVPAAVAAAFKEPFRTLRVNLGLLGVPEEVRSVLVTSAVPSEGKSTVVRNLALACRDAGLSVVVVEADLRRPTLGGAFGVRGPIGLAEVLLGTSRIDEVLQRVADHGYAAGSNGFGGTPGNGLPAGTLEVITAGSTLVDPTAVLTAERFGALIERLVEARDIVLVDSPPVLPVSDALPLVSAVGGTLLVARPGVTTTDAAERLKRTFDRMKDARILGVVIVGAEDEMAYDYDSDASRSVAPDDAALPGQPPAGVVAG
jgi:receptor protein-tyrosine kinase